MQVVTGAEMREFDRMAILELGIPGTVLMEEAGRGAAEEIRHFLEAMQQHSPSSVLIIAGKGNNGGDGFVIHRWLTHWGYKCTTLLLAPRDQIKGDARVNLEILQRLEADVRYILDEAALQSFMSELKNYDLLIDAILGTGLSGNVEGLSRAAIEFVNGANLPVVAVDIPSGLDSLSGMPLGIAVKATLTLTFALPKLGLLLDSGQKHVGDLKVVDIGMPERVVESAPVQRIWLNSELVRSMLPLRPADGHKGTFGRVLVLAGSTGMTGAAALASEAALRSGAGLVTLGIPASLNPIMEVKLTEVMTKPLPEENGQFSVLAIPQILAECAKADVVAIGPGIGQGAHQVEILEALLQKCQCPLVIDADGLNNLRSLLPLLKARTALTVLTPHPGEMARLVDASIEQVQRERASLVPQFAAEYGVILVAKGSPTLTAMPDGKIYINSTGNEGMGTGGSGDVLTGLISGLLAQNPTNISVPAAVFVHGLAGDAMTTLTNHRSMIAGDLAQGLAVAFSQLEINNRR